MYSHIKAGLAAFLALALTASGLVRAQSTVFTYQGQLKNAGALASGAHDLRFRLFDAATGGAQVGPTLCADNTAITDGLFTVDLDFGAAFPGPQRFLEIEVRPDTGWDCSTPTGFVPLSPRQELTPTPYAMFAASATAAATAESATNTQLLNGQAPAFYQNAANINTGTLADSRLSTNISLLNSVQTFTGSKTFNGGLTASSFTLPAGAAAGKVLTSNAAGSGSWQNPTLLFPFAASALVNPPNAVLEMTNTGAGFALRGVSSGNGTGVAGISTSASGVNQGVYGASASNTGTGVYGEATSPTGSTYGGKFFTASQTGIAVYAEATALSGVNHGGQFVSNSTNGIGVSGIAGAATGSNVGGLFQSNSTDGYGLISNQMATTGTTHAGYFFNRSTAGTAVKGLATATTGANYGGFFQTDSSAGTGLLARATQLGGVALKAEAPAGGVAALFTGGNVGIGTAAPTHTVHIASPVPTLAIQDTDAQQVGYISYRDSGNAETAWVGYGSSGDPDFSVVNARSGGDIVLQPIFGNVGIGTSVPGNKLEVQGGAISVINLGNQADLLWLNSERSWVFRQEGTGAATALKLQSIGGGGGKNFIIDPTGGRVGIGTTVPAAALHVNTDTLSPALRAHSGVATGIGVVGSGGSYGVFASGNSGASGTKSFRIDHPQDPENKYLMHYCPESPEVLNFYRGTATLDSAGEAIVELPSYFAAINKDPSYQLTGLGAPMPLLHIAHGIDPEALRAGAAVRPGEAPPTCAFRIAGGVPGAQVCWRVEALRNDRWVQEHGAPVEVEKQDLEKGAYQHPELYGQPQDKRLFRYPAPAESAALAAASSYASPADQLR